jgi:hypothetical protein
VLYVFSDENSTKREAHKAIKYRLGEPSLRHQNITQRRWLHRSKPLIPNSESAGRQNDQAKEFFNYVY